MKNYQPLFKIVSDLEKDGSSSRGKRSRSSRRDSKLRAYSAADLTDRGRTFDGDLLETVEYFKPKKNQYKIKATSNFRSQSKTIKSRN